MDQLILFQRGQNNPLFDTNLVIDSPLGLAFILAAICLLLGNTVYTDIHRGRIIRNSTVIALIIIGVISFPFFYSDPVFHLLSILGVFILLFIFAFLGVFAMGDIKLYFALALLLGLSVIPLMFISFVLIILYSLPIMYKTVKTKKEKKKGERLGTAPGGPGIAFAFPVTLYGLGMDPLYALLAAGCILLGYLISRWLDPIVYPDFSENKGEKEAVQIVEN